MQWGNRTRRYLNRWMEVAGATGDAEKILEQFVMERLLDAMSPELRAWLKDQNPNTVEELGDLANLHVQCRKGPLVAVKVLGVNPQKNFVQSRNLFRRRQGTGLVHLIKRSPTLTEGARDPKLLVINVASQAICLLIVVRVGTDRHKDTYCA